jgi:hypothetical protein
MDYHFSGFDMNSSLLCLILNSFLCLEMHRTWKHFSEIHYWFSMIHGVISPKNNHY